MTVTTTISDVSYTGNGVTSAFSVPFRFLAAANLSVRVRDLTNVETLLTLNVNYTVTGGGESNGGTLTLTAGPLASGHILFIERNTPRVQEVAFQSDVAFSAQVIEQLNDADVLRSQEDQRTLRRAVVAPRGEPAVQLPLAVDRAGKFLAFDGAGAPVAASGGGGDSGLRTDLGNSGGSALVNFQQLGSGSTLRSVQDKLRDIITVLDKGADPTGTSESTAAFTLAAQAAVAVGAPLLVPFGTYIIDNWTPPSGLTLLGERATLRRPAAAIANNTMIILANGDITLRGLTIDGNKANNTLAANSVVVTGGGNYTIEHVSFINAKRVAGGFGSGLVLAASTDEANDTQTTIRRCTIADNDSDGILVDECWNIAITENKCSGNGGSGIALANYDTPIEPQSQRSVTIAGNFCLKNGDSGIVVAGTTTTNVLPPITDYQAINISIEGNECIENGKYGIAAQATVVGVWDNICVSNGNDGGSRITFAGILFNAYLSACEGNIVSANEYYGIDAGGAFASLVGNNIVSFNGNAAGGGTGINIGAAVNSTVRGNSVINNGGQGAATGVQVYCPAYDSNGSTSGGLPYRAVGNVIENNFIELTASTQTGVYLQEGPQEMVVRGNTVRGGLPNQAFILETDSMRCAGNVHTSALGGLTIASAATIDVTDYAEELIISGTTTITNIRTRSQNANFEKVAWITVTNGGGGYTSPPTVVFTGGGGSGAAAQAYIGDDGKVRGILMTNKGSGYTSAPSISFTGGDGAGAAATATVGCNNRIGRRITMIFAGNAPVAHGSGTNLAGATIFTPGTSAASTLSLLGMYGTNWHEVARSVV